MSVNKIISSRYFAQFFSQLKITIRGKTKWIGNMKTATYIA